MNSSIKIILLDIEGTTTPIDFVSQVLFPYARNHVRDFLAQHWNEVQAEITQLQSEHTEDQRQGLNPPALDSSLLESVIAYIYWLMDQDRKSTPLKSLQGKIWEEGYKNGVLKSQLFSDVPTAFKNWQQQRICIFSSGSVLAQKLLFTYTEFGDLSKFISGWFDTNIGNKQAAASYLRIANALYTEADEILFVSDVVAELEAARAAGMQTRLSIRPGNPSQPNAQNFQSITSFDQL
jgi:enolase-phosphatase E1